MTMTTVIPIPSVQKSGSAKDKNLKIRDRHFANANQFVFDNKKGGFVSLPILFRRLLKFMKPKQLELLIYLWLRTDKYGLCFPGFDEIAHELGQKSVPRLKKTARELETMKLIETRNSKGRTYFIVGDPRHGLHKMYQDGKIQESEIEDANDLLEQLRLQPIAI
jgi:predicted NACHT family NTPase